MDDMRRSKAKPIKVSVSCVADFINSKGERTAESLLRPYKFNKRGEGFARSSYYRYALTAIRDYHSRNRDPKVFESARFELQKRADITDKNWERIKLEKNVRAIEAYQRVYKDRNFTVLANHRISYPVGPIVITAQPDLWVDENGNQVLLKIGIAKKKGPYVDILLTVIRKAAISSGYTRIRAKNVVYLNVTTGKEMICTRSLSHFNRTFQAIARTIAQAWPNAAAHPISEEKRSVQPSA